MIRRIVPAAARLGSLLRAALQLGPRLRAALRLGPVLSGAASLGPLLLAAACETAELPPVVDAYGTSLGRAEIGEQLNLFIWPDYLDPELVEEFESTYGVRVVIDYYDTNEAMIAKLRAGGTGQYDLAVASDYAVEVLAEADLMEPIDRASLPNFANLDPRFVDPPFDPGNVYSVPYQWGTSGLGVRMDLVEDSAMVEPSWALVFDAERAVGPFTMLNDPRETIGAALLYLGHSANTTDSAALADAEALLVEQQERVLTYAPFATARDLLGSGDATVAHNYSGDVLMVQEEVDAVTYLIPSEGSIIWTDNFVIPSGAPNKRLAEAFINFILDARVGARLSNFTYYATPNAASFPFVDADLREDPAIFPPPEVLEKLEFLEDVGEARAAYDRIWTRLRAGAGG